MVLALEEFEELVTFELGIGADILLIKDLSLSITESKTCHLRRVLPATRVPQTPSSSTRMHRS